MQGRRRAREKGREWDRQRELQQDSIVTYWANPLKKSRHNPQYNIEINPRQPYNATKTIRHVIRLKISILANGVADWQAGRQADEQQQLQLQRGGVTIINAFLGISIGPQNVHRHKKGKLSESVARTAV